MGDGHGRGELWPVGICTRRRSCPISAAVPAGLPRPRLPRKPEPVFVEAGRSPTHVERDCRGSRQGRSRRCRPACRPSTKRRCRPNATTMPRARAVAAQSRIGSGCPDRSALRRAGAAAGRTSPRPPPPAFSAACSATAMQKRADRRAGEHDPRGRARQRRRAHPRARAAIAVRGAEQRARRSRRQRRIQRTAVARPDRRASTAISTRRGSPNGPPPSPESSYERVGADEHKHEIIIVRHAHGDHDEAHHGGVWKIAFADFMTAMMCFFLVMWLINAANEQTKAAVASYFNPVKLIDRNSSRKGLEDIGDGPNAIGSETEKPQTLDATTRAEGHGKGGAGGAPQLPGCQGRTGVFRRTSVCRPLRRAGRDRRQHRRRPEHLAQGRRRRAELRPGDRGVRRRIPTAIRSRRISGPSRSRHPTKPRPTGRRPSPRAP